MHHSTLGSRVIKKKKKDRVGVADDEEDEVRADDGHAHRRPLQRPCAQSRGKVKSCGTYITEYTLVYEDKSTPQALHIDPARKVAGLWGNSTARAKLQEGKVNFGAGTSFRGTEVPRP